MIMLTSPQTWTLVLVVAAALAGIVALAACVREVVRAGRTPVALEAGRETDPTNERPLAGNQD
ncbi:hypothetical protein GCM10027418_25590 [Mariniluteicoccus endophyticus]